MALFLIDEYPLDLNSISTDDTEIYNSLSVITLIAALLIGSLISGKGTIEGGDVVGKIPSFGTCAIIFGYLSGIIACGILLVIKFLFYKCLSRVKHRKSKTKATTMLSI